MKNISTSRICFLKPSTVHARLWNLLSSSERRTKAEDIGKQIADINIWIQEKLI
jgi:hypothetical protein